MPSDNSAGIAFFNSNVAGQAISSAMTPPIRQMQAASINKLQQDGAVLRADGFAHADFARPFRDRDEHDVHDADAADEQ